MPFNMEKFKIAAFAPREAEVELKETPLVSFFEEGEKKVWKVRGLTADELARCNDAASKNKAIEAVVEALTAGDSRERVDAMRKVIGVTTDVHNEVAKRMEMLVTGSVDPVVTLDAAVKIATVAPIEFYQITTQIINLTGLGHRLGEAQGSGDVKTSESV